MSMFLGRPPSRTVQATVEPDEGRGRANADERASEAPGAGAADAGRPAGAEVRLVVEGVTTGAGFGAGADGAGEVEAAGTAAAGAALAVGTDGGAGGAAA